MHAFLLQTAQREDMAKQWQRSATVRILLQPMAPLHVWMQSDSLLKQACTPAVRMNFSLASSEAVGYVAVSACLVTV